MKNNDALYSTTSPDIDYKTFNTHDFIEFDYYDYKCKNCELKLYKHSGENFIYYTTLSKFRNKTCNELLMQNVIE